MTFYLKPPRNKVFLHTIQSCVIARVNYFTQLRKENNTDFKANMPEFEYLILNSPFDRVGHFMLRLLILTTELISFKSMFIKGESELFSRRLNSISSPYELKKFIRTTSGHCNEAIQSLETKKKPPSFDVTDLWLEFIITLKKINEQLLSISNHLLENACMDYNCDISFKVPFKMSLNRLSKRLVLLKNGYAISPCSKWKENLSELFEYHLYISFKQAERIKHAYGVQNDVRFCDIVEDAICIIRNNSDVQLGPAVNNINKINIDDMAVFFPPCMFNLQRKLKINHRLTHNSRYQLTVFLKTIGMQYKDALQFWSEEYSMAYSKNSKCNCSWQKNNSRLKYSIRHIYGLEGRRANYRAHSCSYLQGLGLGATDEGGCPFKYFDDYNLFVSLDRSFQKFLLDKDFHKILLNRKTEPTMACSILHSSIITSLSAKDKEVNRPVSQFHYSSFSPVRYFSTLLSHSNHR